MSTTAQPAPFHWQQVDQRLSSILLSKVSEEMNKLITDDVGHIRFQNMHNGNDMTVPSERLQMHRLRVDEWAARLYEGYCEIWQAQRMPISAEFLRGIVANVISMVCSARAGSVTGEFVLEQHRTRRDANWLQPALEAFKRDMQLLHHKWIQAAEFDATTVQHMLLTAPESSRIRVAAREVITAKARIRTLEAMIASAEARIEMAERALNGMLMTETPVYRKRSIKQSVARLKDQRKEWRRNLDKWELRLKTALHHAEGLDANLHTNITTQSAGTPDLINGPQVKVGGEHEESVSSIRESPDGPIEQKTESHLVYKSALKRGIMAILLRNPKASDIDICHDLDLDGASLPTSWKMDEIRFFESAYRDERLRSRMHTAISKVRADLRRNRVIR